MTDIVIINSIACLIIGIIIGITIILVPYTIKKAGHNNHYFTNKEMLDFNYRHRKFASDHESYSKVPSHIEG